MINNTLPFQGLILGSILKSLVRGGGLLIRGLHYPESCDKQQKNRVEGRALQPSAALSEVTDAHNADNVTGETPVQGEASEKEATQKIEEKASEEKALSLWF